MKIYQSAAAISKLIDWRHILGSYSPQPGIVTLQLTMSCNLTCPFCFQSHTVKHMPYEMVEDIIDDLKENFIYKPQINLYGGEPTIHPDFLKILRLLKVKGFDKTSVITNGSMLKKFGPEMVEIGLKTIRISVDGPADIHDRVRQRKGLFKTIKEGCYVIQETKKQLGKQYPDLHICSVIIPENQTRLRELVDVAKELNIKHLTLAHLMFDDGEDHAINSDHLLKELKYFRNYAAKQGIELSFYPNIKSEQLIKDYYTLPERQLKRHCITPWGIIRVNYDGSIGPCSFGRVNVSTTPISQLWNGEVVRKFRKIILKEGVIPECGRCCQRLYD